MLANKVGACKKKLQTVSFTQHFSRAKFGLLHFIHFNSAKGKLIAQIFMLLKMILKQ